MSRCVVVVLVLLPSLAYGQEKKRTDCYGDPLPTGAVARFGTLRLWHSLPISALAFAPDGKTLASSDSAGIVRIWETATGREIYCFGNHEIRQRDLQCTLGYSLDGKLLAATGVDYNIQIWDLATGEKRLSIETRFDHGYLSFAFTPDGKTLAAAVGNKISWYDPQTGKRVRKIEFKVDDSLVRFAFSPDGKRIAYALDNHEIGILDSSTGKVIKTFDDDPNKERGLGIGVLGLAFSRDGSKLFISKQTIIKLIDVDSGEEERKWEAFFDCPAVLAPDGKFMAIIPDRELAPVVCDLQKKNFWHFYDERRNGLWCFSDSMRVGPVLALSPSSKLLASGGQDGCVHLWDIATRKEIELTYGNPLGRFSQFTLSRDGKHLGARDSFGEIRVWNLDEGKLQRFRRIGKNDVIGSPSVTCVGSQMVLFGEDASRGLRLDVLDAGKGRGIARIPLGHVSRNLIYTYAPELKAKVEEDESKDHALLLRDLVTKQPLGRFEGHFGNIVAGVFSPDCKSLATSSKDYTIRIWDVATKRERHCLKGHGGGATVTTLAFSSDSKCLATAGNDGRISVWNSADGQRLRRWAVQDDVPINCLALSSDGKWLLANAAKGCFRLWDVTSGSTSPPIQGHRDDVVFAAFLSEPQRLLTASMDGTALIWDLPALRTRRTPPVPLLPLDANGDPLPHGVAARFGSPRLRHRDAVTHGTYSPDGRILATSSHELLRLWDADSGKEMRLLRTGKVLSARQIAFLPDGRTLAELRDNTIHLWDVASGESRGIALRREHEIVAFAVSPNGERLAAIWENGMTLWNLETGRFILDFEEPFRNGSRIVFTADGTEVVASEGGNRLADKQERFVPGTIGVWEIATGKRKRVHNPIQSDLLQLAPDGRTYIYRDTGRRFHVHNALTGEELWVSNEKGAECVYSCSGKYLSILDDGGMLLECEAFSGKEVRRLPRNVDVSGRLLCLSPNGATLAAASPPTFCSVRLWDIASGRDKRSYTGHRGKVTSHAFTANGGQLVIGDDEGTLCIWDVKSKMPIGTIRRPGKKIMCVTCTSDGKRIAAGDDDGKVTIWDSSTGKELWGSITPNRDPGLSRKSISSLAFVPDERILYVLSKNGTISCWDMVRHKVTASFSGYAEHGRELFVTPDGKRIVCLGSDMSLVDFINIRVWDRATQRKVAEISTDEAREIDSFAYSPDGKLLAIRESLRNLNSQSKMEQRIVFYELATGQQLFHVESGEPIIGFSPDGRYLLAGQTLWDMRNGCQDSILRNTNQEYSIMGFTPNGRNLFSYSDATLFFHTLPPMTATRPSIAQEYSESERKRLWDALAAPEPQDAWPAMRTLMATPKHSLPFLQTKLQPIDPPDPRRLKRLLFDLDSNHFAKRERAFLALSQLGELAEPALRRTLDEKPSPEVRRRLDMLLVRLEAQKTSAADLRILRVICILEQTRTKESIALLRRLAEGAPGAHLTTEAARAMQRIERFKAAQEMK
jgi:WD40 repeat protein